MKTEIKKRFVTTFASLSTLFKLLSNYILCLSKFVNVVLSSFEALSWIVYIMKVTTLTHHHGPEFLGFQQLPRPSSWALHNGKHGLVLIRGIKQCGGLTSAAGGSDLFSFVFLWGEIELFVLPQSCTSQSWANSLQNNGDMNRLLLNWIYDMNFCARTLN